MTEPTYTKLLRFYNSDSKGVMEKLANERNTTPNNLIEILINEDRERKQMALYNMSIKNTNTLILTLFSNFSIFTILFLLYDFFLNNMTIIKSIPTFFVIGCFLSTLFLTFITISIQSNVHTLKKSHRKLFSPISFEEKSFKTIKTRNGNIYRIRYKNYLDYKYRKRLYNIVLPEHTIPLKLSKRAFAIIQEI